MARVDFGELSRVVAGVEFFQFKILIVKIVQPHDASD
jgi:hypothetical protein